MFGKSRKNTLASNVADFAEVVEDLKEMIAEFEELSEGQIPSARTLRTLKNRMGRIKKTVAKVKAELADLEANDELDATPDDLRMLVILRANANEFEARIDEFDSKLDEFDVKLDDFDAKLDELDAAADRLEKGDGGSSQRSDP